MMKPPRSPIEQRCSTSPGIAATRASVNCGPAWHDEMSSYSPTRRSMRVTGRDDQKFAPRVAWSVVMRIVRKGSGRFIRYESDKSSFLIPAERPLGRAGLKERGMRNEGVLPSSSRRPHVRQHPGHVVDQRDGDVVLLEHGDGAVDRLELVEDELDAVVGEAAVAQAVGDDAGDGALLAAAAVLVLLDDDVVELR